MISSKNANLNFCSLFVFFFTLVNGQNLTIVVLLPLSSSEYANGQAASLGVSLSLARSGYLSEHNITIVTKFGAASVKFYDTKCDPQIEKNIQRGYISHNILLLGGGCRSSLAMPGQSAFLSDLFPQITFEEVLENEPNLKSILQLRPNIYRQFFTLIASSFEGRKAVGFISSGKDTKLLNIFEQSGLYYNISVSAVYFINSTGLHKLMQESKLVIFILALEPEQLRFFLCSRNILDTNRYSFFAIVNSNTMSYLNKSVESQKCLADNRTSGVTFLIENEKELHPTQQFLRDYGQKIGGLDAMTVALSFDATTLLNSALLNVDNQTQIIPYIGSRTWEGSSGSIIFKNNVREYSGQILKLGKSPHSSRIAIKIESKNIPLWLFSLMSSLAFIGVIFAFFIIGFNIHHRLNRTTKLTSPIMNTVICIAAILLFCSVPLAGSMALTDNITLIQITQSIIFCLAPVCVTTIFLIIALKSWRLYAIFGRLSNRRISVKDGKLLLYSGSGSLIVAIIHILILALDTIKCRQTQVYSRYEESSQIDIYFSDWVCLNKYWTGWLCLQACLQVPVVTVTLLFAWRIRHITIPSLCDTKSIYMSVLLASLSIPILYPVLIEPESKNRIVVFTISSIVLLLLPGFILTVYLLPKVVLVLRHLYSNANHQEGLSLDQAKITESYRNTQRMEAAEPSCCSCLKLSSRNSLSTGDSGGARQKDRNLGVDEYLQIEMQNLNRTIEEKDRTIRELTDRLFYGYGKYQEGCAQDWLDNRSTHQDGTKNNSRNSETPTEGQFSNPNNSAVRVKTSFRSVSPDSALENTVSESETGFEVLMAGSTINTNVRNGAGSSDPVYSKRSLNVSTEKESRV